MENRVEVFNALHHQPEPLLVGNVWNVQSARVFEKLKFKAIATSSAAVAETLGYADGEQMSFEEYLFVVRHVLKAVALPLSVDLEAGYGTTANEIAKNIDRLATLGVVGINIEDSIVRDGKRSMTEVNEFTKLLEGIGQNLKSGNVKMFINVRCDAFLLGLPNPVDEAIRRMNAYQQTGVQGLFFPCITKVEDIRAITQASKLPVNVMCMPGLPDFTELQKAGVKRISMGNFLNHSVYNHLEHRVTKVLLEEKFDSLWE